jgi:hypothetical protein
MASPDSVIPDKLPTEREKVRTLPVTRRNIKGLQLGLLPLAHRLSQDREVPLPGPSANVREAQEVARLRLAFTTLAPILFRKGAKFDDSRLVGMQLQPKLRASLAQFRQKPLCFMTMLESRNKI